MYIYCDNCKKWLHMECVHLTEEEAKDIEEYVCIKCQQWLIFKYTFCSILMSQVMLVVGPSRAGKSSLIDALTYGQFHREFYP